MVHFIKYVIQIYIRVNIYFYTDLDTYVYLIYMYVPLYFIVNKLVNL